MTCHKKKLSAKQPAHYEKLLNDETTIETAIEVRISLIKSTPNLSPERDNKHKYLAVLIICQRHCSTVMCKTGTAFIRIKLRRVAADPRSMGLDG